MHNQKITPLVSIVVPVYNVEQYIAECISSLLNQSYSNIEILLIDDGSNDASGLICDNFAQKDKRIRVLHIINGGVSHARNVGIEASTGEWLTFVDSDDTLDSKTIQIAIENIRMHVRDIDVLQFGSTEFQIYYKLLTKKKAIESLKLRNNACASLYKTYIIKKNNIRFIEGLKLGEDQLFNFTVIHHCRYCLRIPDNLYHYRRIKTSSSNNPTYNALLNTLKEIQNFPYTEEFRFYIRNLYITHIFQLIEITTGEHDREFSRFLIKDVFKAPSVKEWHIPAKTVSLLSRFSPYLAIKSSRLMLKFYKTIIS